MPAALSAMRVLTNQAETGAVTLAMPQDVQAEAHDFPEEFLGKRVWRIGRPLPDSEALEEAAALIRGAQRPLVVTGARGANRVAKEADVVIGIGTRWSDFTTASKTAFQHSQVRFVNINVADFD